MHIFKDTIFFFFFMNKNGFKAGIWEQSVLAAKQKKKKIRKQKQWAKPLFCKMFQLFTFILWIWIYLWLVYAMPLKSKYKLGLKWNHKDCIKPPDTDINIHKKNRRIFCDAILWSLPNVLVPTDIERYTIIKNVNNTTIFTHVIYLQTTNHNF